MPGQAIFVSYRRDDTADAAGRIYDRLVRDFGEDTVFKDVDTLPPGADFGAYIRDTLSQCRVVLALIGKDWLEASDADGMPRLHAADDWVRIEIETALANEGVQVIPVLVSGAAMPTAEALPLSLQRLPALNAAIVGRDPNFHRDMDRLVAALKAGALTGLVLIEEAPSEARAGRLWADLKTSRDIEDLMRFAESFPGTEEAFSARRRAAEVKVENERAEQERQRVEEERRQADAPRQRVEYEKRLESERNTAAELQARRDKEIEAVRRKAARRRSRAYWTVVFVLAASAGTFALLTGGQIVFGIGAAIIASGLELLAGLMAAGVFMLSSYLNNRLNNAGPGVEPLGCIVALLLFCLFAITCALATYGFVVAGVVRA